MVESQQALHGLICDVECRVKEARAGVAWLGPAFLGENAVRSSGGLVSVG